MARHARIVEARHIGDREGHGQRLALAGLQQAGLIERGQDLAGLAQNGLARAHLGRAVIDLQDLLAGVEVAHVGDRGGYLDVGAHLLGGYIRNFKIRIGQAVTEGIADRLVLGIKGLKVAVTGEDIFGIFLRGAAAEFVGGICVKALGHGLGQFAGGGDPAGEDIADVIAALLAAVTHEDQGVNAHILHKLHIGHNAVVIYHSDLIEVFGDQLKHLRLVVRQEPAALVVLHVVVFAHDAPNDHNGLVVALAGFLDHLFVQRHLGEETVAGIDDLFFLICRVVTPSLIDLCQGLVHIDAHVAQAVQHIDLIGGVHVGCAQAAADGINLHTAKYGHLVVLRQGKGFVLIFQEDHALVADLPGKLDALFHQVKTAAFVPLRGQAHGKGVQRPAFVTVGQGQDIAVLHPRYIGNRIAKGDLFLGNLCGCRCDGVLIGIVRRGRQHPSADLLLCNAQIFAFIRRVDRHDTGHLEVCAADRTQDLKSPHLVVIGSRDGVPRHFDVGLLAVCIGRGHLFGQHGGGPDDGFRRRVFERGDDVARVPDLHLINGARVAGGALVDRQFQIPAGLRDGDRGLIRFGTGGVVEYGGVLRVVVRNLDGIVAGIRGFPSDNQGADLLGLSKIKFDPLASGGRRRPAGGLVSIDQICDWARRFPICHVVRIFRTASDRCIRQHIPGGAHFNSAAARGSLLGRTCGDGAK